MINKIFNFMKALCFHIGAGCPKSTQTEINKRYAICESCQMFHNDQCLECGCNISTKSKFLNKLAWKDQKCPLGKW